MTNRPFIHLRKSLDVAIPKPVWPSGISPATFEPHRHLAQAHALLVEAYSNGGGESGSLDAWWSGLRDDPEYDPSLFFLALDPDDRIVGLAQCWTSGFLKDLAVAEAWRRQGIGEALLRHAFTIFQARGTRVFDLKVEIDNPSGAGLLYRRLGMKPVPGTGQALNVSLGD